ncbi:uncharacterized protein LOC110813931 isoform X1 [Carica papaya]|uniref:uncharacterized protein LOC110813931 isoform X1 n=1 Tax=Carica papaya TaxID=3649 RepID=UPI000B8CD515|nr:uncharacterized protein LOC110813931 isoform X1 [Carica papaya]
MEDMNIDFVVDIPDTPDRIISCQTNTGEQTRRDSNSTVLGLSRNSGHIDEECFNQRKDSGIVFENGQDKILHFHHRKVPRSETEGRNKDGALLFRKAAVEKNSGHEKMHFNEIQHVDKEKATCPQFPSKLSAFQKGKNVADSNQHKMQDHVLGMSFPQNSSKNFPIEGIREAQNGKNGGSSLLGGRSSRKTVGIACKGKEKMGGITNDISNSAADKKDVDMSSESQPQFEKRPLLSHQPINPTRANGQRRLVRNGCISPHVIAARAKQVVEHHLDGSRDNDIGQSHSRKVVSSDTSPIDIRDIVADDNVSKKLKGKGVLFHSHTLREPVRETNHLSCSPNLNKEEANGTSDASGDILGCFEGLGGWRSTRYRTKKTDQSLYSTSQHPSGINNVERIGDPQIIRENARDKRNTGEPFCVANIVTKRQQRNGLNSENHGACAGNVSGEQEVVFLGSSGESSNSRSSKIWNHHHQIMPGLVFEVDDSSPDVVCNRSRGTICSNSDESDARARQVEADEILARALQEQLYQEATISGGDNEVDESVAWALQQEENLVVPGSSHNRHRREHRSSSIPRLRRQLQTQSLPGSSNRRVSQAQASTPVRMRQFRSRFSGRAPAASSRPRNFRFPAHMNLEMRLDILEEMEAALEDLGDPLSMTSHFLQIQRDFNANDYEMLLALDENNNQHVGASVNQINSLPVSKVQTDAFGEDCAICLETPTTGDSIRHLPCLHKFHKDCIDQWLRQKSSCPVCKSSITSN